MTNLVRSVVVMFSPTFSLELLTLIEIGFVATSERKLSTLCKLVTDMYHNIALCDLILNYNQNST